MATYDVTAIGTNVSLTDTYDVGSKSMQRIPGQDKVIISWLSELTTYVQAFSVNKTNGNLAAIGSPLNVGSCGTIVYGVSVCIIDSTNFAIFWNSVGDDGFCQLFKLDSTGNVSSNGSSLEYDTTNGTYPTCVLMDSTHILNIWSGDLNDGYAQIFTVNTTNGTITKTGSAYEFDTSFYIHGSLQKINETKAIIFYTGLGDDGYAKVLSINTSTWAVTAAGSTFEFRDAVNNRGNACVLMPNNKIINIYTNKDNGSTFIRSFSINDSTWEITAWGAENNIGTIRTSDGSVTLQKVDDTHVIALHQGVDYLSYCRVLTLNTSNGSLANSANVINLYNAFVEYATSTFFEEKPGLFLFSWSRTGSNRYSRIQSISVEMPPVAPTVTTQAVSDILPTTATGNGNITDTGGVNPHLRGIAYMPASSGDISFIPLPNPSFEDSTLGWAGAGTLARSSEQAKYGTYSMKVSWTSGSEAYGEIHPTPATYSGKKITFSVCVWSSVANMACLNIYDNAGAGYEAVQSAYHPGDSTWRLLTVTKTLRNGLTDLILRCRIVTGSANSAYFDGVLSPYSDSVSPTLSIDSGNYSTGAFTKALTGLTPNTDYRAVAFAQNSVGVGNGSTVGFTTLKADESNFFQLF